MKINERKTKGLGYDKVKKEIEKAKRDGRLEMLVIDQETFDYCKRTKKPMKEPEMKVKHIFPKSRSSASFHKLPIAAASVSRDSTEQFDDNLPLNTRTSVGYRLSTPKETDSENEEDNQRSTINEIASSQNTTVTTTTTTRQAQPTVNFHLNSSPPDASSPSHETPLKFFDRTQPVSQQSSAASNEAHRVPPTAQSTPALNQSSTKDSRGSKSRSIPHAINSLFQKFGHSKSSKRS